MEPRGFQYRPPGGDRGRCALRGRCNLDNLGLRVLFSGDGDLQGGE